MIEDLVNFDKEKQNRHSTKAIIGVDEVGRGSFAGPVVSCAVYVNFNLHKPHPGVKDSKKLSAKKRKEISEYLKSSPGVFYGMGIIDAHYIDHAGIVRATALSMERAIYKLQEIISTNSKSIFALIDGTFGIGDMIDHETIIKGDDKSYSIACASILAKVDRDELMEEYHKYYFNYGFDKNKGYGTKEHREALALHGISMLHRTTFCKKYYNNKEGISL